MLSWRLLLATGKARYADLIERTLYNGLLAGVSLSGDKYLYVNPLQRRDGHALPDGGDMRAERTPWFRCACCPPNVMRTLASLEHYVLAADDASVVLAQYISGNFEARIAAGPVRLAVATGLPWNGSVTITVNGPAGGPWALVLRVPAWSPQARVTVNGAAVSDQPQDGWLRITRDWHLGDVVTLELDMAVRVVAADPRVDTARGAVALERGPLVYCLEGVDQPAGFRLDDVVLDPAATDSGPRAAGPARRRRRAQRQRSAAPRWLRVRMVALPQCRRVDPARSRGRAGRRALLRLGQQGTGRDAGLDPDDLEADAEERVDGAGDQGGRGLVGTAEGAAPRSAQRSTTCSEPGASRSSAR